MGDDLDVKIVSKERAFWLEIQKAANEELEKIELNYFKSKTFQEAIKQLCEEKLKVHAE